MDLQTVNNELTIKIVEQITTEILIYKQQTAYGIIEIGKRLIAVKEQIGHGNWENYLKEKVDFSYRTATKFMQIANDMPNMNTYSGLTQSKLYLLLDVPAEERETFIETKHVVIEKDVAVEKTVQDMTTRELQKVIAEKKALEMQLSEERNKPAQIKIEYKDNPATIDKLQTYQRMVTNSQQEVTKYENQLYSLQKKLKELEGVEKNQQEISKLYREVENLKEQKSKALNDLKDDTKVFEFVSRTEQFIQKEMLHIPTLIINFNKTDYMKNKIINICELLDNFTFSLKHKFGV